eukprot:3488784-Pleurochrysis_carterae.AAC.1
MESDAGAVEAAASIVGAAVCFGLAGCSGCHGSHSAAKLASCADTRETKRKARGQMYVQAGQMSTRERALEHTLAHAHTRS